MSAEIHKKVVTELLARVEKRYCEMIRVCDEELNLILLLKDWLALASLPVDDEIGAEMLERINETNT